LDRQLLVDTRLKNASIEFASTHIAQSLQSVLLGGALEQRVFQGVAVCIVSIEAARSRTIGLGPEPPI
jgi:hypothetical protein